MWDESMVGVNAIEMSANHNYIVSYINGYPDMYMTSHRYYFGVSFVLSKLWGLMSFRSGFLLQWQPWRFVFTFIMH